MRYDDPDEDRSHSVIRYIGNRVLKTNKNFLCAVTGQTGIGKSWYCGSIAEIYSKRFNIEYNPKIHTFFSLQNLLELLENYGKDIKRGSILVYDEAQVEANARSWHAEANKILSTLVSTFRNRNLVLLFPTPRLDFIDKQSRLLFHAEFKMTGMIRARA